MVAAAAPFVTTDVAAGRVADLFAVVALLLLGTVALALAGLDTGTAFGGMGASREITIAALAEPTLLVAVFALSVRVGSSNLAAIVEPATLDDPARCSRPASLLAAVALVVVIVAEAGRLPVDNPATHLELTMIHEAMILEYAGRGPGAGRARLGDAADRAARAAGQPLPALGSRHHGRARRRSASGSSSFAAKVAVLGAVLAAAEVFMAKLRLFRVPELLAGSFLFGVLAVSVVLLPRMNTSRRVIGSPS